ncbi:MAG: hypothetical protein ABH886_08950 [Candidatus Desantisbacteria bacterium]
MQNKEDDGEILFELDMVALPLFPSFLAMSITQLISFVKQIMVMTAILGEHMKNRVFTSMSK